MRRPTSSPATGRPGREESRSCPRTTPGATRWTRRRPAASSTWSSSISCARSAAGSRSTATWRAGWARAGGRAAKAGSALAYPPPAFEFEPIDGVRPIDVLLEQTPRDLLGLELDTFWASIAGVDPVQLVEKH